QNVRGKRLRTVFMEHKLGRQLPLIVLIHGMGAQLGQWSEQIKHFATNANVLAFDIVGHGQVRILQLSDAYTTSAIVEDICALLSLYKPKADSFILIGHSYGCNLITFLYPHLQDLIKAIIFLCPKSTPTPHEVEKLRQFVKTPTVLVDILRYLDRRGGIYSPSVNRLVGKEASPALRERQIQWNAAHSTRVAKWIFKGAHFAEPDQYAAIRCPVLLIGAAEDLVCPVTTNLEVVHAWLSKTSDTVSEPFIIPNAGHQVMLEHPDVVNAIMYNWLIETGFTKMDLSYQLQLKKSAQSKWSLKNYEKWKKVAPVSAVPVKTTLFRPMKTMQQDDPEHTPRVFAKEHPEIGLVIDISREAPPYAAESFNNTTCVYQKLATTSKIPPTRDEVKRFCEVAREFWRKNPDTHIGVHCHYGFNRTGFMVCSYLIEQNGCTVAQALANFAEARPPGIRHIHFKDELYMRYTAGVMRSPNRQAKGA
ncbi:Alpha/Beta hydrolase protein, partial [Fimicolochytrium jonesii]|uniref:Alpha/Beta hydrolase protein n=1 Tax=Fimicolochytrium jonesii TaxID=1396493 RepID=UPI0022FDF308